MTAGITKAFTLEDPAVELRWGLHERGFRDHFKERALKQITIGHFKIRCRLLGGMDSEVHFQGKSSEANYNRPLQDSLSIVGRDGFGGSLSLCATARRAI